MGANCCKAYPEDEASHQILAERSAPSKIHGGNSILTIQPSQFVVENSHGLTDDYTTLETLGQGSSGGVYKVLHKKSGEVRAIKWIKRRSVDKATEEKLAREIDIVRQLDHPSVLRIHEFASDERGFLIVSELLTGGELFDTIAKQKYLTEAEAAHVMKQLLGAVAYCHAHNVIHRDLRPENILVESVKDGKINVKIIDFGAALVCSASTVANGGVGSVYYVSPEMIQGECTPKSDIWSLGVMLYLMLSGATPFYGREPSDVLNAIAIGRFTFEGNPWDAVSAEAKDLITKMLTHDHTLRVSAADAFAHPWFKICDTVKLDPVVAAEVMNNLKGFRAKAKLQQAAMMFIVSQLMTKEERTNLQSVFSSMDKNSDGMLTRQELIEGYTKILGNRDQAEKEVIEMLKSADVNLNGEIDYSEFLVAAANKKKLLTLHNVKQAFDTFDTDKSGFISPDEVKAVLGRGKELAEDVWSEIIAEVDTNGDGKISYPEFQAMMEKYLR